MVAECHHAKLFFQPTKLRYETNNGAEKVGAGDPFLSESGYPLVMTNIAIENCHL